MDKNYFNKKLRELRRERRLTQGQVAEALGIKLNTYAHMEKDGRRPSFEMLSKLSDLFLVSIDELKGVSERPRTLEGTSPDDVRDTLVFGEPEGILDSDGKAVKRPQYMRDMQTVEQDIILKYRMLSDEDKQKFERYINRTFKNKDK